MSKLSGIGGRLYRGETSFDFIGKRRRWYAFSGVLIVVSALALSIQGLHLGIEFKGGSEFTISKAGISIVDARSAVASTHVPGDTIIQKLGILNFARKAIEMEMNKRPSKNMYVETPGIRVISQPAVLRRFEFGRSLSTAIYRSVVAFHPLPQPI